MSLADWTEGGAEFDVARDDGIAPTYRHKLWRARGESLVKGSNRRLGVCMLNPSKAGADPRDNDPTVKKLIGFCERWDFGRFDVVNWSDFIATVPKDLAAAVKRLGPLVSTLRGDECIRAVAARADVFLVAWGNPSGLPLWWTTDRQRYVFELINRPVVCIRRGNGGHPLHPVREAYTKAPLPWEART